MQMLYPCPPSHSASLVGIALAEWTGLSGHILTQPPISPAPLPARPRGSQAIPSQSHNFAILFVNWFKKDGPPAPRNNCIFFLSHFFPCSHIGSVVWRIKAWDYFQLQVMGFANKYDLHLLDGTNWAVVLSLLHIASISIDIFFTEFVHNIRT